VYALECKKVKVELVQKCKKRLGLSMNLTRSVANGVYEEKAKKKGGI